MLTAARHTLVVNTHTCMVFEAVAACGWIIEITEMDIANAGDLVLTSDGIRLFLSQPLIPLKRKQQPTPLTWIKGLINNPAN